jgi:hypothetical protein
MQTKPALILLLTLLATGALFPSLVQAFPSEQFQRVGRHIRDDWGIFRTRSNGPTGFLAQTTTSFDPIIARESMGENADVAWALGKEFILKYPDRNQRAERIFYYVRDKVVYTSDSDQFDTGEFAQNADEVAATIAEKGSARGDCEDSALLLAVLYEAAGFRSAMVLVPGHIATVVHLPEYRKAPRMLTLEGDPGWVWAEATGASNPFGWLPESVAVEEMTASEVIGGTLEAKEGSSGPATVETATVEGGSGASSGAGLLSFIAVAGLLWIVAGARGGASRRGSGV